MRNLVVLLACLASIGYSRRLEDRGRMMDAPSASQLSQEEALEPEKRLATLLLALDPAAAWNPSGASARLASGGKSSPSLLRPVVHGGPSSSRLHPSRSRPIVMNDDADPGDRLASAAVYLLPLVDGFNFGRFAAESFPPAAAIMYPVFPIVGAIQGLLQAVPFGSLLVFVGLIAISNNAGSSRYLRFNVMQALVMDIGLQIVSIVGNILPNQLLEVEYNTAFYALIYCLGYAAIQIARGKFPDQLPIISEAAASQMMF